MYSITFFDSKGNCNGNQLLFLIVKVIVTVISYNLAQKILEVFKYLISRVIVLVFRYI